MTQEIINVGEAPNDGAGDPLRTAFIKTNNNFSTLFATGGITGIANGTSNLQIPVANGSIRMAVGNVANVFVVNSSGTNVTGNSSVSGTQSAGNITVGGTVVANGTIQSLGAVTAVTITASGNLVGGNLNIVNLVRTSDMLVTGNIINAELNVSGNIIANRVTSLGDFIGSNFNTINGNIAATGSNLTMSGLSIVNGNVVSTGSLLQMTGFTANSGRIITTATANIGGNVQANYFIGNGSQLVGITAAPANIFNIVQANGTSVVATSPNDTLSMVVGNNMTLAGDNLSRTVTFGLIDSPTYTGTVTAVGFVGDLKGTVVADDSSVMVDAVDNKLYATGIQSTGIITATGNVSGGNIVTAGNVTGAFIIGNGSQLTGVTSYGNANAVSYGETGWAGNIIPSANITYDLGTANKRWKDLYLANSTIYIGSTTISANNVSGNLILGNVQATGFSSDANVVAPYFIGNVVGNVSGNLTVAGSNTQVVFNDAGVANASAGFTFNKATNAIVTSGNITASGNISGSYILGNGALLSGVITSVANINLGTSNVTVISSGGNITVGVGGTSNVTVFSTGGADIAGYMTATGNVTGGNITTAGLVSATGNVSGGNAVISNALYVNSGNATTAIVNSGANGVGNIGSSTTYFNTVFAMATSAQYADISEKYLADSDYEPGTVMSFGGSAEVTMSRIQGDAKVAGVISTNPAYSMNDGLQGQYVINLALTGRVPCKVSGIVHRGDMMVSDGAGRACASANPQIGSVIGKALENFHGSQGVIEVVVGRI